MGQETAHEYLIHKYMQIGLFTKKGEWTHVPGEFNPNIDPRNGSIPFCSTCQEDFEKGMHAKGNETEWIHSPACLWYDYFTDRLCKKKPGISIKNTYGTKKSDHRTRICMDSECCQRYGYWDDMKGTGWEKQGRLNIK